MRSSLLLAAALLSSLPALADVYTARDDFHFSLSDVAMTGPMAGDLHVNAMGVYATHGARRLAREGELQNREVVVINEPYEVKDASGGMWKMWIRMPPNGVIEVELMRVRQAASREPEVFTAVSVKIDGTEAKPTFGELELTPEGSYRLGTVRGRIVRDEAGVQLDGVPSKWGRGTFAVDGDALTFRYRRGQSSWEVKYARKDQPVTSASKSDCSLGSACFIAKN